MFNPSRDQARRFFIEAWQKQLTPGGILTPLEHMAVNIVALHPEYHDLLGDTEAALSRDWTPEMGQLNPFLHLSLHLAVEEQLSIDQPPGLRAAFGDLLAHHGDRHEAMHDVLECLGEIVWKAQREHRPPDGQAYLECVRRRTK